MGEWERLVQEIVEYVDECIKKRNDETVTLSCLAQRLKYSEFYISRKFREMGNFDYAASGYSLDTTQGRVFYFYHDPERFWKYVRPVKKL